MRGFSTPGLVPEVPGEGDEALDVRDQEIPIAEVIKRRPNMQSHLEGFLQHGTRPPLLQWLEDFGLKPLNPGIGDRLASILMGFSGYRALLPVFACLVLAFIPQVMAIAEGNFYNPDLSLDGLHDIGYWTQFAIALPAIVVLLGMYFGRLPCTIFELILSNTFVLSKHQYAEFKRSAEKIYENRLLVVAPYMVGIAVMLACGVFYHIIQQNTWHFISLRSDHRISYWLWIGFKLSIYSIMKFLLYYSLTLCILRIVATFFVLKKFFRFSANIQPLHPDSCGGLSPLGSLSMRLNVGAFMFGIVSVLGVIANTSQYNLSLVHPMNLAVITAYIAGATVAFFLPLYSAHRRMTEAKYHTVQIINQRFEQINKELLAELADSREVNESKINQMEALRKVHEIASNMPVYPFNLKTVSSFVGSVLTPLLIFLLEKGLSSIL